MAVLKGVFGTGTEEPVSYVNAPRLAEERGVEVKESSTTTTHDYVSLVTVRGGAHAVSGTLTGPQAEDRIVMVDDHNVEVPFAANLVFVRNDDRPGMIGIVGTALGDAGVSISNMAVSQTSGAGTALMVLSVDGPVPADVLAALRARAGILDLNSVAAPRS